MHARVDRVCPWTLIRHQHADPILDRGLTCEPDVGERGVDAGINHQCICSALRWWNGRRLITRYTGRCLVIVDSTMNYKLIRAYCSKLRALAWRFTTFGVAGQNPQDHFVHEMLAGGLFRGSLGALYGLFSVSLGSL